MDKSATRGGWKITDEARRTEVLAAYAASGLTSKAFARQEGVNYHTLVAWRGRERRVSPVGPAATAGEVNFTQLQLGPTTPRA